MPMETHSALAGMAARPGLGQVRPAANDAWACLEAWRVPDALIARAYDAADPAVRACFKQDMAAVHAAYAHLIPPLREEQHTVCDGLEWRRQTWPVRWCLVCADVSAWLASEADDGPGQPCAPSAASMAQARKVVTAAASAILSGVEEVWAVLVCPDGARVPKARQEAALAASVICAGLDVAGVENIALLDAPALAEVAHLLAAERQGRLVLLGGEVWQKEFAGLACAAQEVALWREGSLAEEGEAAPPCAEGGWQRLWPALPRPFFLLERICWRASMNGQADERLDDQDRRRQDGFSG